MPASRSRSWGPDAVTYAYRTEGRRVLLLCVDDEELPALEPELAFLRAPLARQRSTGHEVLGNGFRQDFPPPIRRKRCGVRHVPVQ
ncbi:hypothetical protein [Streptomyces virginiae]|uniref:hypothetical protein n=1 Tax=Streptomyces virginiae TaxID=1961 RepID=UPI00324A7D0B